MKIEEMIEIIQGLLSDDKEVRYNHPQYRIFHEAITSFVYENSFQHTEEWQNIKSNLLLKSTQYLTRGEANIILVNLEGFKRKLLETKSADRVDKIFFGTMHPTIVNVSEKKFLDGHYADSVESAFKEIDTRLKKLYKKYKDEELYGKELMYAIFNYENKKNQRLLVFEALDNESGKNVQEGYMHIFAGAMQAIRNPKAHENLCITKAQALDRLIFASMLMRKIDEAIFFSKIEE